MKDQYGNEVPDDLVLFPSYILSSSEEIETVIKAQWYEVNGWCLCASFKELCGLSEDSLADAGISKIKTIDFVDDCLHRYNPEDGFYHA
jgi:hypothetical protein